MKCIKPTERSTRFAANEICPARQSTSQISHGTKSGYKVWRGSRMGVTLKECDVLSKTNAGLWKRQKWDGILPSDVVELANSYAREGSPLPVFSIRDRLVLVNWLAPATEVMGTQLRHSLIPQSSRRRVGRPLFTTVFLEIWRTPLVTAQSMRIRDTEAHAPNESRVVVTRK